MKRRTYKELHQYQLRMIDWMLDNQNEVIHKYYQMGLDGEI